MPKIVAPGSRPWWRASRAVPLVLLLGCTLLAPTSVAGGAVRSNLRASASGVVPSGQLEAVSCPTTTFCMAVGLGVEQTTALAETWTGGAWTVSPAVSIGPYGSYLSGVSCTTASSCMAVGTTNTSYSDYVPLIEQWDGSSWTVLSLAGAVPADAQLNTVSCPTAGFCAAVGWGNRQAFVATWDGTTWTGSTLAVADNTSTLGPISCSGASDCLATGWQQPCIPGMGCLASVTLVAAWNGTGWSLPAAANGAGVLAGPVSCLPGTPDCVVAAEANDATSGLTDTVVDTWDGTNWTVTPGPTIGPTGGVLAGISCGDASACLAVGNSSDPSPTVRSAPVATVWNGSSSTLETPVDPSATFAELLGASCTSTTECTTVGVEYTGTVPHTLVETWDAGTWTVVPSPDAPVVTIVPPVLTIATTSLPDAAPGTPYGPVQLQDSGVAVSTSPYLTTVRWSKGPPSGSPTALPKGMTLSPQGVLSGTPNAHLVPADTMVSVRVTEKVTTVSGTKKVHTTTTVAALIPLTVG